MVGGLVPEKRFHRSYYSATRYEIDPVTGQIVVVGQPAGSPGQPITRMANADITSVGLAPASEVANKNVGGLLPQSGAQGGGGSAGEPGELNAGPVADSRNFGGKPGQKSPSGDFGSFVNSIPGGVSTVGTVLSTASGFPGGGLIGSAVDTVLDKMKAEEFDPTYEGDLGKWGSAFINDLTGGLLGKSHFDRNVDEYQDRTGTGLNDAALGAAQSGRSYSGPKGIAKREQAMKNLRERNGGQSGERDRGGRASGEGAAGGNENAPAGRGRDGL